MCSSCSGDYENPDFTQWDDEAAANESDRAEAEANLDLCLECDHPVSLHAKDGCEYEADKPDPDIGQVAWRCGCKAVTRD